MAAPAPPPPPTFLEGLDVDTQRMILSRIPCSVDRGRMSLVCRAWRDLIRDRRNQLVPLFSRPRALPWLLLRAPFPDGSTRVACVLSGCRVHHYLDIIPPEARCFGSHDGAWLFLDTRQPRAHMAINIRTGVVRDLPLQLQRRTDPYDHRMVIHAAALSSSPEDANYVGAAIVTSWRVPAPGDVATAVPPRRRCVALWRKGWPRACDFVPPDDDDVALDVEDVLYLYHSGAFLFLTQGEHIRACTPVRLEDNRLRTNWQTFRFRPRGRFCDHGQYVRARYLVVISEELLMVVRFTPEPNQPTSKFKVFRVTEQTMPDARYRWAWSELETLGGLMLFVGHGCSKSYEVDQYPGFKEGVYFLDDGEFYDEAVILGTGNVWRYPCSDNGKWSEEDHVQRCFPRPDPSDHSAPVWLLP